MGRLIPDDFDITSLPRSEQKVVQAFVNGISPEWLVLPSIAFIEKKPNGKKADGETDVVLIHPTRGIVVVETKGGMISVKDGTWYTNESALNRSPAAQACNAKHVLKRKIMEGIAPASDMPPMYHAVAFPDVDHAPAGALGTDLEKNMIFTRRELFEPESVLKRLTKKGSICPQSTIDAIVKVLRPDIEFSDDLDGILRYTQRRLSDETMTLIRYVQELDINQRVIVDGPAGTGKTRIATTWTHRAIKREERVLLFCFNTAMGEWLAGKFEDHHLVTAGPFVPTIEALLEPTGFEVPERREKDHHYFRTTLPGALLQYIDQIPQRFDTIVIDEVQDVHSDWFPAIQALLDPTGAKREYYLGDRSQNIFDTELPADMDNFVRFPLSFNCRNTKQIALLAKRVGGGELTQGCPEGPDPTFRHATGVREVRKRVAASLAELIDQHHIAPTNIAIITDRNELRDALMASENQPAPFVRWSDRDEGSIVCENVQAVKGLEWRAVIFVSIVPVDQKLKDHLYIGITRATTWLHIVAPRETADLLGMAHT